MDLADPARPTAPKKTPVSAVDQGYATGDEAAEPKVFVPWAAKASASDARHLAEAVQSGQPGDTIEVRGNGPFDCGLVKLTQPDDPRAEGFRPVQVRRQSANRIACARGLNPAGARDPQGQEESFVYRGYPHMLQLRFRAPVPAVSEQRPNFVLRNCEFLCVHMAVILDGK